MESTTRAADPDLVGVIASAVAGDEYAFARLVAANYEDMRRVSAFVTRDDALAEDATQAACTVVWRKLGDPEATGAYPPVARVRGRKPGQGHAAQEAQSMARRSCASFMERVIGVRDTSSSRFVYEAWRS